jgi:predicted  nucleic acid-binding Zn-ribbon protein
MAVYFARSDVRQTFEELAELTLVEIAERVADLEIEKEDLEKQVAALEEEVADLSKQVEEAA